MTANRFSSTFLIYLVVTLTNALCGRKTKEKARLCHRLLTTHGVKQNKWSSVYHMCNMKCSSGTFYSTVDSFIVMLQKPHAKTSIKKNCTQVLIVSDVD